MTPEVAQHGLQLLVGCVSSFGLGVVVTALLFKLSDVAAKAEAQQRTRKPSD